MHHPTQYQLEANIRQQERLQQAAAHRAAREGRQGSTSPFGRLLWPFRVLAAVVRWLPRPHRSQPGPLPDLSQTRVQPERH